MFHLKQNFTTEKYIWVFMSANMLLCSIINYNAIWRLSIQEDTVNIHLTTRMPFLLKRPTFSQQNIQPLAREIRLLAGEIQLRLLQAFCFCRWRRKSNCVSWMVPYSQAKHFRSWIVSNHIKTKLFPCYIPKIYEQFYVCLKSELCFQNKNTTRDLNTSLGHKSLWFFST